MTDKRSHEDQEKVAQDDSLSALYQSTKSPTDIPPELDQAILSHARNAAELDNAESEKNRVVPLRKRWEVPAALAASVMLVSALVIQNLDQTEPNLDGYMPRLENAGNNAGVERTKNIESDEQEAPTLFQRKAPAQPAKHKSAKQEPTEGVMAEAAAATEKKSAPALSDRTLVTKERRQRTEAFRKAAPAALMAPTTVSTDQAAASLADEVSPTAAIESLLQEGEFEAARKALTELMRSEPEVDINALCETYPQLDCSFLLPAEK